MIVNLTPHHIDLFDPGAPDVVATTPAGIPLTAPVARIERSGLVARIAERVIEEHRVSPRSGAEMLPAGIVHVEYGHVTDLPDVRDKVWYVVSLATALAVPRRPDLLVPWRQVRNVAGTVIGCRGLARPC